MLLTIGELAERTGVAATALRYYDDLGVVVPVARVGGQRRYDGESVKLVAVIVFLREVGFTLDEIGRLLRGDRWRDLAQAKLAQLAAASSDIEAARSVLEHSLACPAGEPAACPTFWSIVESRLPTTFSST